MTVTLDWSCGGGRVRRGIRPALFVLLSVCSGFAQEQAGATDEPADRDFVQKAAQAYYDALIKKDFGKTAEREVFAVQSHPPDLVAYGQAMQQHPYVGAERIAVRVTKLDSSGAWLELRIASRAGIATNPTTWSRTGTPRKWVAPMTQLTMAGMPGFQILSEEDEVKPETGPTVTSKIVFKETNKQEGRITRSADGPVHFVRPPKVMPAGALGKKAYALGFLANTGQTAVTGIAIRAVVSAEDGGVLETKVFRPPAPVLNPGSETKFEGTLDHLDPKRTEFSLEWDQ